jgi:hypothetical protein
MTAVGTARGGSPPTAWMLPVAMVLALWGAAAGFLLVLERERPAAARAAELFYLPEGPYLKVAVLGYRQITADLIWLKAIQHFGERRQTPEGYRWAYHAVDVLTDLDPQFALAYQVAGTILGVWANLPHESIAILSKGMANHPGIWQFPFYLGYDYFYELHDPLAAAKYFRIAAGLPGSPEYLPRLAARMTVEAGDPDAALEFLLRLYAKLEDDADSRLREGLAARIREVTAERDIRVLEQAVQEFKKRYGRFPTTIQDLVARRVLPRLPVEPLGGVYVLNADGSVGSTGLRERVRIHRHYMGGAAS